MLAKGNLSVWILKSTTRYEAETKTLVVELEYGEEGRGHTQQRGSVCGSHPAAQGLFLDTPEIYRAPLLSQ